MSPLTTEEQVAENTSDIKLIKNDIEGLEKTMDDGFERLGGSQERSDKRISAIMIVLFVILGSVITTLLTVVLK